jgi:hypothetical protein
MHPLILGFFQEGVNPAAVSSLQCQLVNSDKTPGYTTHHQAQTSKMPQHTRNHPRNTCNRLQKDDSEKPLLVVEYVSPLSKRFDGHLLCGALFVAVTCNEVESPSVECRVSRQERFNE